MPLADLRKTLGRLAVTRGTADSTPNRTSEMQAVHSPRRAHAMIGIIAAAEEGM